MIHASGVVRESRRSLLPTRDAFALGIATSGARPTARYWREQPSIDRTSGSCYEGWSRRAMMAASDFACRSRSVLRVASACMQTSKSAGLAERPLAPDRTVERCRASTTRQEVARTATQYCGTNAVTRLIIELSQGPSLCDAVNRGSRESASMVNAVATMRAVRRVQGPSSNQPSRDISRIPEPVEEKRVQNPRKNSDSPPAFTLDGRGRLCILTN